MKRLRDNPIAMTCLFLCLCVAAMIAYVTVYAAQPATVIHACYNNTTGNLRRTYSPRDCRNHETAISWNITGPQGPAGPQGPTGPQGPPGPGATIITFRHTRTIDNTCGPSGNFSFMDNPSINGNANAMILVTGIVGINGDRTNINPNGIFKLTYTGSESFGSCPAGRWIVSGGDLATGAQFNVMVVGP